MKENGFEEVAGSIYRRGAFQEPERVDLDVSVTSFIQSGHIVTFQLSVQNLSDQPASGIALRAIISRNGIVQSTDENANNAGCAISGLQIRV